MKIIFDNGLVASIETESFFQLMNAAEAESLNVMDATLETELGEFINLDEGNTIEINETGLNETIGVSIQAAKNVAMVRSVRDAYSKDLDLGVMNSQEAA